MHVDPAAWIQALTGGALIGAAGALLLLGAGRIAGVSGIFAGAIGLGPRDILWRLAFVAGLVAGGALLLATELASFHNELSRPLPVVAIAGLLVGFGVRLGSGCTSGHGVCGMGRGSLRSVAATLTFMTTGAVSTYVATHLIGW